ncbi:MAG TPA: YciI family protein [Bryobacteraceae bacterium]|nr:YciI family protein [Bryobacteraceae bacterium]
MQYLLLIYEDEKRFANGFPETEFAEYGAFGKKNATVIKSGQALQPTGTAKAVRVRNGETLTTDGPFAETKEQLGGYYLIEAPSIDEATSIAAGIPGARYGSIEVRPIMIFS